MFEYEIIKTGTTGGSLIRFNERVYKPGMDTFEVYRETEDIQTMTLPEANLPNAHESWQKAQARVNARAYAE